MDTIKTDKYCLESESTHLSTIFIDENKQERGVSKCGF